MKKSLTLIFAIVVFFSQSLLSQQTEIQLKFDLNYNEQKIEPNIALDSKGLIISKFKFYISNISFSKGDSIVYFDTAKGHLIDIVDTNSLSIRLTLPDYFNAPYDKIKFDIGIDSLTNHNGVHEGDLDPSNGMYWAWQSGYINLKLEGVHPESNSDEHKFEYHIGGFLNGFYPIQSCSFNIKPSSRDIFINVDLSRLVSELDFNLRNRIMSPSTEAVQFSSLLPNMFEISK